MILTKARELISDPNHWTKNTFARDHHGNFSDPKSPNTTCWCSLGALKKYTSTDSREYFEAVNQLEEALLELTNYGWTSIAAFNDAHTHEQVLEIFDKAIENAASKAPETSPAHADPA